MTVVIDATGVILGRLASYAAKQTLLGRDVVILNSEKAIVSGKARSIVKKNLDKLKLKNKGTLNVGPYHQKRPDRYVRRTVRGMLPWETTRGREAFKRVMTYIGEPVEEVKKSRGIDITKEGRIKVDNLSKKVDSYLSVGEICRSIGGK